MPSREIEPIEPTPQNNPLLERPVSLTSPFSDDYTIRVTPDFFPSLFDGNDALRVRHLQAMGQSPTTFLFTLKFTEKSRPLLEDVLKIPASNVTLGQIREAANLRIFPSTQIVTIDVERDISAERIENEIVLSDITGWVERQTHGGKSAPRAFYGNPIVERGDRFYALPAGIFYFNQAVARLIPDPKPDMAHGIQSSKDIRILQYAVFHAILGSKFKDLKTIPQPEELCGILGLQDPKNITKELYDAVSIQRLKQLTTAGVLSPDDYTQYLEQAAEWMYKIADYANRTKKKGAGFSFPYLVERKHHYLKSEDTPPVEFLPFLHDAYFKFLLECPNYPKEGEYFKHDDIVKHLNVLRQFSTGLLFKKVSTDLTVKDKQVLSDIFNTVKRYRASFARIMKYLTENPGLLNKRSSRESRQPTYSFQQFADGLRDNLSHTTKAHRISYSRKVRKREV